MCVLLWFEWETRNEETLRYMYIEKGQVQSDSTQARIGLWIACWMSVARLKQSCGGGDDDGARSGISGGGGGGGKLMWLMLNGNGKGGGDNGNTNCGGDDGEKG